MSNVKNSIIKMLLGEEAHEGEWYCAHEEKELKRSPPRRYWWRNWLRPEIEKLEEKISSMEGIVKAVAHIGVDWGYGKYELEQEWINKARTIYEENGEPQDPTLKKPEPSFDKFDDWWHNIGSRAPLKDSCEFDTDGDGNCHVCARIADECIHPVTDWEAHCKQITREAWYQSAKSLRENDESVRNNTKVIKVVDVSDKSLDEVLQVKAVYSTPEGLIIDVI